MSDVGDGYELLYLEVYPRLAAWVASLVGDDEVGRDIAAESFARLLARRIPHAEPSPFLYRVALNQVRDRWRHQQVVERTAPLLALRAVADGPDGLGLEVRDAVERLPARLRDPLVLHYFADLPVAQVAVVLRRPVGTITRRLVEGRNTLRPVLEPS